MADILIVEDNVPISDLIKINLDMVKYTSKQAFDGNEAIKFINNDSFKLVILDIMLPVIDGYSVMEHIKLKNIPVIFLTAKDKVNDVVKGLKLGADDYIRKPFHAVELLARIEVVLNRYNKETYIFKFCDIEINQNERTVKKNKVTINLTLKEFELLLLLVKNQNIAISREKILNYVWGYHYVGATRTVDVHIQKLRKKLNLHNIKSVNKFGYRLEIN